VSEDDSNELYLRAGYAEVDHCIVYELDIAAFRAPVNRQQLQLKRQYQVLAQVNPESPTWWDACIFGPSDRIRFVLQEKQSGTICGETTLWDMGPLSTRQPGSAMGLISFRVLQAQRGQGLGEFLLAESLRQLQASGISRVQAQTRRRHEAAQRVLAKLGFQPEDEGIIFGK
jgi:RimJ/RimL family protein N-acetyltransferase